MKYRWAVGVMARNSAGQWMIRLQRMALCPGFSDCKHPLRDHHGRPKPNGCGVGKEHGLEHASGPAEDIEVLKAHINKRLGEPS